MSHAINRRFLIKGGVLLASATALTREMPLVAGGTLPVRGETHFDGSAEDPRLPKVLTVDYTYRDHEVVDYQYYSLDSMPRVRFRGPRFDPREVPERSFFTAFGSAHTLGVLANVAYPELLAKKLGMPGWNVGVGGISASFYNQHPQIIEYANRGAFAIVQITAARIEGNDRIQSTPAAQIVFDRQHGDFVSPELAWARIEKEEPENLTKYTAQSRATWAAQHRKLLGQLTVPKLLLWFSARPMEATGRDVTNQVGSTATTAFPQYVDGTDVAKIAELADGVVVCVTSRNAGYALTSRFTGEPVSVNHRFLTEGRGPDLDMIEDRNTYYPSPEMSADAAELLFERLRKLSLRS